MFKNHLQTFYDKKYFFNLSQIFKSNIFAQSAGAAEYTDCTSREGPDFLNKYLGYDTKQSDGEVPVMLELWGMRSTPSLPSLPVHSGSEW